MKMSPGWDEMLRRRLEDPVVAAHKEALQRHRSKVVERVLNPHRRERLAGLEPGRVGYTCTNPFDRPLGSGGFVRCRKASVRIRFLYSQA